MFSFKSLVSILVGFLTLGIILVPISVNANFRISPSRAETTSDKSESWFVFEGAAGDIIEDTVKIENDTLDDILVKVSPHDLKTTSGGNFTVKNEGEENTEVG